MSRPLRVDYEGAVHHVTARTNRSEHRFACPRCRSELFGALAECSGRYKTRWLAYAVMNTHIHLALKSEDGRLARTMQYLMASLTRRINVHHGHHGHVFRGRYFNRVVEGEEYLTYLLAYIHLNPHTAGMPGRVADARWTSHAAYVGGGGPDWLETQVLLDHVGGRSGYDELIANVRAGRRHPPIGFAEHVLLRPRSSDILAHPEGQPPDPIDPVELLERAESVLGPIPRGPIRGQPQDRRNVAMLWMVRMGATQREVASAIGLRAGSISKRIRRARELVEKLPEAEALHEQLLKSA